MTVTETILKILSARYGVEITAEEETNEITTVTLSSAREGRGHHQRQPAFRNTAERFEDGQRHFHHAGGIKEIQ